MANPSLQIGDSNWAIKEDNLLGYSTAGTRFVPQPITMTRASAGTRVNSAGLVETVGSLGSELVTNGDFSQEGPELVNYPDFSSGGSWNGSISVAGGQGTKTSGGLAYQTGVITSGKQYKIVVDVASLDGPTNIYAGGNSSAALSVGVQTIYMTGGSSNDLLGLNNGYSTGVGSVFNSISVKEVGQDWTFGTGWGISGNLANFTYSTPSSLTQDLNVTSGLSYLIEYEIVSNSGVSLKGGGESFFNVGSSIPSTVGFHSFYVTAVNSSGIDFRYLSGSGSLSVTNVSVKEATVFDLPRVDYTDGTSSLLVEPQRTNLVTYSEDFSQWTIDGNASITSNATTSPDGTENATKLIAGSSSGRQAIKLNNASSGDLAVSVFAKKGEYSVIQLSDARNATAFINFDLLNGSVGSSSVMTGEIVSLGNDWYKCIATYNSATNIISMRLSIAESSTSARLVNFSGNGTDGLYIYGAQLEEGSYPTSYIKTSGLTVTRNQETYTKTGISDKINSEEGVLFVEMAAFSESNLNSYITIGQNTSNGILGISFYTGSNNILLDHWEGASETYHIESISDVTEFNKIAICYDGTSIKGYINGSPVWNTTVTAWSSNALSELNFAFGNSGTNKFLGKVKQLQIFKTALSDPELVTLTT